MMNDDWIAADKQTLRLRPQLDRRLSRRQSAVAASEHCDKIKYAFIGLSGRAGTTTLAFAFAEYLAGMHFAEQSAIPERNAPDEQGTRRCAQADAPQREGRSATGGLFKKRRSRDVCTAAVVEINDNNKPSCGFDFDRVGMDKRFMNREYASFYRLLARGKSVRSGANFDGGINWVLRVPGEAFERFDVVDFIRLIDNASGDVVICDINGSFGASLERDADRIAELRKILNDMDRVCVVIDPAPSAMMADPEKLEMLKDYESSGGDIVYIMNKQNPGVNRRETKKFLKVRDIAEVPYFSPADIYAAEYNCQTVFSVPNISKSLIGLFKKLCNLHASSTLL
jgi:hypothetical protein